MRNPLTRCCAAVAMLLALSGCDYLYHERLVYAIEGATLMDGTAQPPVENAVVVVEEGKITAMAPAGSVKIPREAQRIDAKGEFIFPLSLAQTLKIGGPADLIMCSSNPARTPNYTKYIDGGVENGRWWSKPKTVSPEDQARQQAKRLQ